MSRGNNFFRHNANNVGNVFLVARLPSAPNNTIDENCGSSLTVVRASGGANLASSSLTRSLNLAISLSVSVGSVVISGGGAAAFLAALLLVLMLQRCVLSVAAKRCAGWVRRPRLTLRLFLQEQSAVLGRTSKAGHFCG